VVLLGIGDRTQSPGEGSSDADLEDAVGFTMTEGERIVVDGNQLREYVGSFQRLTDDYFIPTGEGCPNSHPLSTTSSRIPKVKGSSMLPSGTRMGAFGLMVSVARSLRGDCAVLARDGGDIVGYRKGSVSSLCSFYVLAKKSTCQASWNHFPKGHVVPERLR